MKYIWYFFIQQYRFSYLLTAMIVLAGTVSAVVMTKESDPEVVVPVGVVSVIYPGANPEDVEELIVDEIEQEIKGLDDLETFTSTSSEGFAAITVEFDANSEIEDRIRALKDAVDDAEPDLPGDAEDPETDQVSLSDEPIIVISIGLDSVSDEQFRKIGDTLQDELELIRGVNEAKVVGTRDREVQVTLDLNKLELYNLSPTQVIDAIRSQDAQFPVGAIEQNQKNFTVRFDGKLYTHLVGDIPIIDIEGEPLLVKEVATVNDGLEESGSLSRLSIAGEPAIKSVSVQIFKRDGDDAIATVNEVKAKITELQKNLLKGADIFYSLDRAERVNEDITNLSISGFQTIIIVFLVLWFFLGFREALLASISIPLTFLMTFTALFATGYTINFLSLFSLILALGILVDSSIVIVEGMHLHIKQGKSSMEAARKTINEFQWPVISGILTTISAFVPMMFSSGITGQFIRVIPVTVTFVLVSALFVALALTPVLGFTLLRESDDKSSKFNGQLSDHQTGTHLTDAHLISNVVFIQRLGEWYRDNLKSLLNNILQRRFFALILLVSFFVSLSLPFLGIVPATLFPQDDSDNFSISIELPVGSTLEKTDAIVKRVEKELYTHPEITSFITSVGSARGQSASSSNNSGHLANIIVNLTDPDDRQETSLDIVQGFRDDFTAITDARVKVSQQSSGPPQGSPIEITFFGTDIRTLDKVTRDAQKILDTIPGATDSERSIKEAPFEYVLSIDREKIAQVGLAPIQIAQYLRATLFGTDSVELKVDGEDIDVVVQTNLNANDNNPYDTNKTNINVIENLTLQTPNGRVPLQSLVNTSLQSGTSAIQHEDGDRVSKLTAELAPGAVTSQVLGEFQKQIQKLQLPEGYRVEYGGEAEDVQQSFTDIYYAMIVGIFLIFSILILQFNSYRQPFYILAALPFSLIGVFPGLALVQQPLSFPAFIGVVALLGIVVNDAIILMDQINLNRKKGIPFQEAIVEAGVSRLQPILLTTITTVLGIIPLAISEPVWGPLGASIIFGLIFSTVLTLAVVPLMYQSFEPQELEKEF